MFEIDLLYYNSYKIHTRIIPKFLRIPVVEIWKRESIIHGILRIHVRSSEKVDLFFRRLLEFPQQGVTGLRTEFVSRRYPFDTYTENTLLHIILDYLFLRHFKNFPNIVEPDFTSIMFYFTKPRDGWEDLMLFVILSSPL